MTAAAAPTPAHPAGLASHDTRASYPGVGLITKWWNEGSEQVTRLLTAANTGVGGQAINNYALWLKARADILTGVRSRFKRAGLEMAPLYEWSFEKRIAPKQKPHDMDRHVELVDAILTDAAPRFWRHCQYRLRTNGNVVFEFTGHTGTGKSSCALTVADWLSRIPEARVREYVNFDLGDLPKKMSTKKRGETIIQDEYVNLSGEGARTNKGMFENIEDTTRKSGVNLFVLSPRGRSNDEGVTQARLESIAWNPREQWTLFLVHVDEAPLGVVAIPWCRKELYEEYEKWKDGNVERSLAGNFRDDTFLAKVAMSMFANEKVQLYLGEIAKSLKRAHFDNAVAWWRPDGMLTLAQEARVAEYMHTWCQGYELLAPHIETLWGVAPNEGYHRVARAVNKRE